MMGRGDKDPDRIFTRDVATAYDDCDRRQRATSACSSDHHSASEIVVG